MSEEIEKKDLIDEITKADVKEKSYKEVLKDIEEWYDKHKKLFGFNPVSLVQVDVSKMTKDDYLNIFEEFKIDARHLILANMNKSTFVIRHEELISTIKTSHEKLDNYDNYVKEHGGGKEGESAAMKHFLNGELTEFSSIRTQVIPMLMMELETLASAIDANYRTIETCKANVFSEISYLKAYLSANITDGD